MFSDLNPQSLPTALLEIGIMLLGAFLIGFITAWLFRGAQKPKEQPKPVIPRPSATPEQMLIKIRQQKEQIKKLEAAQGDQNNPLKEELEKLQAQLNEKRTEAIKLSATLENLERDKKNIKAQASSEASNSLNTRIINKLKSEKEEILKELEALKAKVAISPEAPSFAHLGSIKDGESDNLTQIKGIGPVLQKKLNDLGIFTFRQLGHLEPEDEEKINQALELFPDQVKREDWKRQALRLAIKRK